MGREFRAESLSSGEPRTSAAEEKTLTTPSFDEDSIHHARPAVPLRNAAARAARPSSTLKLVALAAVAGIVGGLVGILAINSYQRRPAQPTQVSTPSAGGTQSATRANTTVGDAGAKKNDPNATTTNTAAVSGARANEPTAPAASSSQPGGAGAQSSSQPGEAASSSRSDESATGEQVAARAGDAQELRDALDEWIAATNARDIERQMKLYEPTLASYYLARRASRDAVRAEKENVFSRASSVDVRAADPRISVSPDGQTATMRFRKQYAITGGGADRRGAVIQELRWRRTPQGWRIASERDLKVVQ